MHKWIKVLTALMVAQLILVIIVQAPKLGSEGKQTQVLLSLGAKKVDKITIQAQDEPPLTLVKNEAQWQLPDYHNLAVDAQKVTEFIDKLDQLSPTWPVATSAQAKERFEVAEDKYQRQISFYSGSDKPQVLFLGTSPGYRRTHARLAGDDAIYSVKFSNYEAATTPENWFDRRVLAIEAERIQKVETKNITFEQIKQQWQVSALKANEKVQTTAVSSYVSQLANISVDKVLGTEAEQINTGDNPTFEITVTRSGGEPITYALTQLDSGAAYLLKSSQSPLYFQLAKAQGDELIELDRDKFVSVTPEEEIDQTHSDQAPTPDTEGETLREDVMPETLNATEESPSGQAPPSSTQP